MSKNLITRKIQFLFLIGAILLAPSIARASAVPASVDSLQNLLQNDTDARQRAIIYIHLADIHVTFPPNIGTKPSPRPQKPKTNI